MILTLLGAYQFVPGLTTSTQSQNLHLQFQGLLGNLHLFKVSLMQPVQKQKQKLTKIHFSEQFHFCHVCNTLGPRILAVHINFCFVFLSV